MSTATADPSANPSAGAAAAAAAAVTGSQRMAQGWSRAELEQVIAAAADPLPAGWTLGQPAVRTYSFYSRDTRTSRLASAMQIDLTGPANEAHTVIIARTIDGPAASQRYRFWCGDKFLEGQLDSNLKGQRIDGAIKSASVPMVNQGEIRKELLAAVGSSKKNSSCGFSQAFEVAPDEAGCVHVRGIFHALTADNAVGGMLDAIDTHHDELKRRTWLSAAKAQSAPVAVAAGVAAVAPTVETANVEREKRLLEMENELRKNPLIAEVLNFSGPRVEQKIPVILLGEAGWGKSETLRSIARAGIFDQVIEFPIVNGMDGTDFIGGPVAVSRIAPNGSADRVYFHRDSPFIEACRLAVSGKRVAVLFEELPRASRAMLSALPAIINPNGDVFEVHTGRAISENAQGVAVTEKLIVPRKNLTIWATGNAGGDYDCQGFQEGGDRAVMNRFHRIYLRPDASQLAIIGGQLSSGFGWPEKVRVGLAKFLAYMEKNFDNKMIRGRVNIRDVAWVVNAIGREHQHAVPMLKASANRWTGIDLDGYPIKEQVDAVNDAIDKAFM